MSKRLCHKVAHNDLFTNFVGNLFHLSLPHNYGKFTHKYNTEYTFACKEDVFLAITWGRNKSLPLTITLNNDTLMGCLCK